MRYRRMVAWLGVIALVSNVLAAAFSLLPRAGSVAPLADGIPGPLVICTSNGAQAVAHGGDGSTPDSQSSHCPICTLLAGFALATAFVFLAFTFDLPRIRIVVRVQARILADHLGLGGIRSRAPPFAA